MNQQTYDIGIIGGGAAGLVAAAGAATLGAKVVLIEKKLWAVTAFIMVVYPAKHSFIQPK